MSDQLPLFDPPPAGQWEQYADAVATAPRCRMCVRPARWLQGQQQYAAYCAGKACSNQDRLCQKCGRPFTMHVGGAGTRYCSTECKIVGYHPTSGGPLCCAWCGKSNRGNARSNALWPYICMPCLDPIKHVVHQLKAHHVHPERARQLRDDPSCEICGADILAVVWRSGGGRARATLVVDHDHRCCPLNHYSCGQCVRGLLCVQCNTAAGMLKDNAKHARVLGDYLEAWQHRNTFATS